ncbi:MAG: hypothetical protein B6A08_06150 [Sorangiineae bacterium NIC37A_2]|jgi:hypothetical protein|nr:MAG: hypothetical protein B6A08_06150 [Sorangiineae bacterium NIC37A_2]
MNVLETAPNMIGRPMERSQTSRLRPLCLMGLVPWLLFACGESGGSGVGTGTGGVEAGGGAVGSSGGAPGVGGDGAPAGGSAPASGGSAVGGASASGGEGNAAGGTSDGSGGGATGGAESSGGAENVGGAPVDGSGGGGGAAEPCPADATFCSGFDSAELPDGAVFRLNGDPATPWTAYFEVDSTVKRSGASALRVKSVGEVSAAYKMLSVPSGGANFWVRLYIRSDVPLGHEEHNVFGQASGSDDPNDATSVEFAEDVGISFNSQDVVRWPEGYGRLQAGGTMAYTLPADTWHCVEIHFDGTARAQELYVGGEKLIDAPNYPAEPKAFTRFKFGYNALHFTERKVWYDDVAVGPTRPGCLD